MEVLNFFSHLFMSPFKTETAVTRADGNLYFTRNGNRITIFRVYFIQVSNYVLSKCGNCQFFSDKLISLCQFMSFVFCSEPGQEMNGPP